jgi:hypothetical protein
MRQQQYQVNLGVSYMADISVKDLNFPKINGSILFSDPESFMQDLSEDELNIQGGKNLNITTPDFITKSHSGTAINTHFTPAVFTH